jgi:outer membrane immunogenic protein
VTRFGNVTVVRAGQILRKILAVAFVLLVPGSLALADDRVSTFQGFYVGANIGGGFGDVRADLTGFDGSTALGAPSNQQFNMTGVLGGGQAGYNQFVGKYLFGVEVDIQKSSVAGSNSKPADALIIRAQQDLNWFGTVRGRFGVLLNPTTLAYLTAGLAFGEEQYSSSLFSSTSGRTFGLIDQDVKFGWTLGGGMELSLDQNWSLKGEYFYYDLGSTNKTASPQPPNGNFQIQTNLQSFGNIGRLGVNYRF